MAAINPVTPNYSKAKPVANDGCLGCGTDNNQGFYVPPSGGGKDTELIAGNQIGVTDLSDSLTDRFLVDYLPITQMTADLTLIAKISSAAQTLPILKGYIVDEVNLTWTYNKATVVIQTLTNNGGLAAPTLLDADRAYDYTVQSIGSNTAFTISGDDGLGYGSQSIGEDTKSVTFGNHMAWGAGASLLGMTVADAQILFNALTSKEIRTNYVKNVYATGQENEKFFVFTPKAWGLPTFKKGIFVGGLMRIKKVVGQAALKSELAGGETEEDILITNAAGYSEAYYIHETLFDNVEDPDTPIEIY